MPDYSNTRIRIRRGTDTEWTNSTSVLAGGELAYNTTTTELKVGDGSLTWSELDALGGFVSSIGMDSQPVLGGNLDLNAYDVSGTGNITLTKGDLSLTEGNLELVNGNMEVSGTISADGAITSQGSTLATVDDTTKSARTISLGVSDINHWTPSAVAYVLRVDAGVIDIHGLSRTYNDKKQLTALNRGSSAITFKNDSSSCPDPSGRFYNVPSEDIVLNSGEAIIMTYDDTDDKWVNYASAKATTIRALSQTEYDNTSPLDPNTVYIIT